MSLLVLFFFFTDIAVPPAGLDRKAFDNRDVTYEEHTEVEHKPWNYLYFVVLLRTKDPTEFTGPESYVANMIEVRSLFPLVCSSA